MTTITAENQWTPAQQYAAGELFWYLGKSDLVGTKTLQIAPASVAVADLADYWVDVKSTTAQTIAYTVQIPARSWVRAGVKTGEYTSGSGDMQLGNEA